jgi:hypothetical protein
VIFVQDGNTEKVEIWENSFSIEIYGNPEIDGTNLIRSIRFVNSDLSRVQESKLIPAS